ncbi:NAD(P)H dehydrogenase [Streptomyces sp. HUAS TT7]|uniref:NAD(P)H dehydrogenase n=1 Tax=Streptomyces sp. HUAS TT7 TaxID=3447507 RepID=UPI003F65A21F
MSSAVKLAVIYYYSSTGFSAEIAQKTAEAGGKAGAEVRLLRAVELAPESAIAIASHEAWAAHSTASAGIPVATPGDVEWADGAIFGTPARFGNVSSQLAHSGQESTLLALYNSIRHFGGVLAAPGYTDQAKFVDGNPYGTSHVEGQGDNPVGDETLNAARHQARRVVRLAGPLKTGVAA